MLADCCFQVAAMAECLPSARGEDPETEEEEEERAEIRVPKPKSKPSSGGVKLTKDEEIQESLDRLKNQGKYVKLNVGGSLHYTTIGTLTKHDNMLRAMFSGRIPLETDDEGKESSSGSRRYWLGKYTCR